MNENEAAIVLKGKLRKERILIIRKQTSVNQSFSVESRWKDYYKIIKQIFYSQREEVIG